VSLTDSHAVEELFAENTFTKAPGRWVAMNGKTHYEDIGDFCSLQTRWACFHELKHSSVTSETLSKP